MAQQTTIEMAAATWTQITNADVTNITFQVAANAPVYFLGTAGATPPTATTGALTYYSGQGEISRTLADMFPGVTSVTRLYAYSPGRANVIVSHA